MYTWTNFARSRIPLSNTELNGFAGPRPSRKTTTISLSLRYASQLSVPRLGGVFRQGWLA